jgi:hypothetical protein
MPTVHGQRSEMTFFAFLARVSPGTLVFLFSVPDFGKQPNPSSLAEVNEKRRIISPKTEKSLFSPAVL